MAFAALVAAIGSSISAMVNSASTIFTLDIYRPLFMKKHHVPEAELQSSEHDSKALTHEQETHLVRVGKIAATSALIVGAFVAPLLGSVDQAFQYIQEYTGFISPGVVAVFILGMFWKRTSSNAALTGVLISFVFSLLLKIIAPGVPFIDRMGLSFLLSAAVMVAISLYENKGPDKKGINLEHGLFKTSMTFNIGALGVIAILAVIYTVFW